MKTILLTLLIVGILSFILICSVIVATTAYKRRNNLFMEDES